MAPSNFDMYLGVLQLYDVLLNISQVSNDVILNELQRQNKEYLTKIIEQNETIIKNQKEILARLTAY
jgi:hypothetical protein